MNTTKYIALACTAGLIACGGGSTPIEDAAKDCDITDNLSDDGESISFDTEGEDDTEGDDVLFVVCVLSELDVPDSLIDRFDHTRALDGTQSADWDNYEATWSYHPDSGMFLVVEMQS